MSRDVVMIINTEIKMFSVSKVGDSEKKDLEYTLTVAFYIKR